MKGRKNGRYGYFAAGFLASLWFHVSVVQGAALSSQRAKVRTHLAEGRSQGLEIAKEVESSASQVSQEHEPIDDLSHLLVRILDLPRGIDVEILKRFNVLTKRIYSNFLAEFMIFCSEPTAPKTGPRRKRDRFFSSQDVERVIYCLSPEFLWLKHNINQGVSEDYERVMNVSKGSREVLSEQDRNGDTLVHYAIKKVSCWSDRRLGFLYFILEQPELNASFPSAVRNWEGWLPVHFIAMRLILLEACTPCVPGLEHLQNQEGYHEAISIAIKVRAKGFALYAWHDILDILARSKDSRTVAVFLGGEQGKKKVIPDDLSLSSETVQKLQQNPLLQIFVQDYQERRPQKKVRIGKLMDEVMSLEKASELESIMSNKMDLLETESSGPGDTLLLAAAMGSRVGLVKFLMGAKANVNILSEYNASPLWWAINQGSAEIVDSLIAAGACLSECRYYQGRVWSLLHQAALSGCGEVVMALIEAGVKVNRYQEAESPLHVAVKGLCQLCCPSESMRVCQVVKILIESGADVHALDQDGKNVLHLAAYSRSAAAMRLLINEGVDINAVDKNGNTPLHYAVGKTLRYHVFRSSNWGVVSELLIAKAKIDIQNFEGKTPLDIAQGRGYYRLLLSYKWKQVFEAKK
jgi:ankyrin repeat protein